MTLHLIGHVEPVSGPEIELERAKQRIVELERMLQPWDLCPCGGDHSACVHEIYATPQDRGRLAQHDRERLIAEFTD